MNELKGKKGDGKGKKKKKGNKHCHKHSYKLRWSCAEKFSTRQKINK